MIMLCADLHLSPRAWTNRWSIEGDAFNALAQIQEYALKAPLCSGVIFGGDTTDSNTPDAATLHHLSVFMRRMKEEGIPVYYITGQHDRGAYGYSVLETYGGVLLDEESVVLEGRTYHGLSYRAGADLLEDIASVPICDFLVMHAAFKHLLGFKGAWQVEASDIPEHVSNVFTGDIHVKDVSEFGGLTVYSPGSTYACNSGEIKQEHGFYVVGEKRVEHVLLDTREFTTLDIKETGREGLMALLTEINTGASKKALSPVVFIKIPGDLEASFDKYDKIVIVRLDASLNLVDVSDLKIDAVEHLDLRASLPAVVDRLKEGELYTFLEGLFSAGDRGEFLSSWLKEAGVRMVEK